jgi:acetyltransferase-like isoleucine patch superfamily enzyme
MQLLFTLIFKANRKIVNIISGIVNKIVCHVLLLGQNVKYENFQTVGIPYISVAIGGKCVIGRNFKMNNELKGNPIGCAQKCIFFVDKNAELQIGDNVGISQTALVCHCKITIGNSVKIGGGVCLYDTDFHSLDSELRKNEFSDLQNKINRPIIIMDNVFIGAHSTILKGVIIGRNSIVGACSVVTKSIPENEIWAGNPARFIKKIM